MILALAACGGGGGGVSRAIPSSGNSGGGGSTPSSKLTSTLSAMPKFTATAKRIGPATSVDSLVMHVVVNMQDAAGLEAYAQAASNPTDPRYRAFLTASQIGARYGATVSDTVTVAKYLASYGLRVIAWPQRLGLTVAGPRADFEKAFGTTFSLYHSSEGHTLIAPTGQIHFATPLPVAGIADAIVDPSAKHLQYVQGASGGPSLSSVGGEVPQQIATAFDYNGAYAAGYTGQGINLGIIGTGPAMSIDFTSFKSQTGFSGSGTLTFPYVGSAAAANTFSGANTVDFGGSPTATPPPVTPPCTQSSNPNYPPSESPTSSCNPEDFEAQIDTEQAALAKDANVRFYLAYVPDECYNPSVNNCPPDPNTGLGYAYQGLAEADDEIQQAIADNNGGTSGPDVLSLSYGGPEVFNNAYVVNPSCFSGGSCAYDPQAFGVSEFAALEAEGVAVFVSSGDQGAQGCAPYSLAYENTPCVSYPSGDPDVTSVGGVTAPVNNAGQFIGPLTGWGTQTNSGGASGGGVSTIVPKPSWETGAGVTPGFRNQPDASLEGDPYTGVRVLAYEKFGGESATYGGTSVAAPEMAAMWAVVLSACKATPSCARGAGAYPYRLGNAAPYMWGIYNNATLYPQTFFDVVFGNNTLPGCEVNGTCGVVASPTPVATGYQAGVGYDHVTGIGVPFARHLIKAIVGV
jgi:subtilase family serine protease